MTERKFAILIVDDDVDLASNLEDILVGEGYRTALAHDGQTALTLCREQVFDLAIIDIKLPDIPGVELVSRLASLLPGMESGIITGYASVDSAVQAVQQRSIVAYETKPLNMNHFLALIRQVAERKQAEELYRALASSSPVGVYIVQDRKLVFVNPQFQQYLGFTEDELLGTDPLMLAHAEDREQVRQDAVAMLKGNRMAPYEFRTIAKGGEVVWAMETVISIHYRGKRATLGNFMDITKRRRTEEAWRESEEKYHAIFAEARDGIVLIDSETGHIVDCNPAFESLTGRRLEQLKKMKIWEVRSPEKVAVAKDKFFEITREGMGGSRELEFQKPNGQVVPVEFVSKIIKIKGRDYIQSIARDITKRKQAEEKLKESEKKYRDLVETSHDLIWKCAAEGRFTYLNKAWEQCHGYKLEEMLGHEFTEFQHPETAARDIQEFERHLQGGSVTDYETIHISKTGKELNLILNVVPLFDSNGEIVGTQGTAYNITERKQAEEKFKKAAEEWRTTFDSITDLVSLHDKDRRIIRVNRAFANAFKTEPQMLIGKICCEVVHGTKGPHPNCPLEQTIHSQKTQVADYFEPSLGIHLEVTTSPIFNESGEVTGIVHVAKDITERKQVEQQLILTDRLASIGEMASGVAHELNNPLTSVIGFSQLLLAKDIPDDVKKDIEVIYSEAQRAAEVVKNLLTFARKHAPVRQLTSINKVVEDVLKLRAYDHGVNNIQVHTRFAPELPEIMVDYFQMQQVFLNIILNAEAAMIAAHNGGALTITTQRTGNIIRASLADDGPGIARETLGRLFDPFFTTKEVGEGTGLGLSICHGVITEHGGRIYVESELGQGATFVVELPLQDH